MISLSTGSTAERPTDRALPDGEMACQPDYERHWRLRKPEALPVAKWKQEGIESQARPDVGRGSMGLDRACIYSFITPVIGRDLQFSFLPRPP